MSDLPKHVTINEEGPREGFQSEPPGIPTAAKIELIEALANSGLRDIACCSFVNAKQLPQMADAEAIAAGVKRKADTHYSGLWLNERGFRRAQAAGLHLNAAIVGSVSETFLIRNNNRHREESLQDQRRMLALYQEDGLPVGPAYVFTAFGCNFEGDLPVASVVACVSDLIDVYAQQNLTPSYLCLCDTVGAGNPLLVRRVIGAIRDRWPNLEIALHLHDTRGMGLANAFAGLQLGVARFDSSIGGLGGCPFAGNRGAAGNIATEDFALMCEEMGISTRLDLEALLDAARLAERIVGHPLPGKAMKAGSLARFRHNAANLSAPSAAV